jgi:methylase of polypeptide subunit release factors
MKTFDSSRFFYQNSGKGIVRTPEELSQEMISKIPEYIFESDTTTFLDPACGRGTFLIQITKKLKSYGHSWENITSRIFGIDIDPFSGIKQAQYLLGSKNIIVQDFLEMSFPENWPKEFDVIVSNPPYSKKLDLKFLEKSVDLSGGQILFVHPYTMWASKNENKYYSRIKENLYPILSSISIFNGNGIFDIGLYVPCCITHLDKTKSGNSFTLNNLISGAEEEIKKDQYNSLSIFGFNKTFNSIYEKIKNLKSEFCTKKGFVYSSGGNDHNKYLRNPDSYFVEFTNITAGNVRGKEVKMEDNIYNKDFFIAISKYQLVVKRGGSPKYNIWFEFETEEEGNNFLKYLKTDFARMCMALVKRDQNIKLGTLPWMDFTQEWNNSNLYEHFNITEEEQMFIKETILPYYD